MPQKLLGESLFLSLLILSFFLILLFFSKQIRAKEEKTLSQAVDNKVRWADRIQTALRLAFRDCKTKKELVSRLQQACEHWQGIHTNCSHSKARPIKYRLLDQKTAQSIYDTYYQPKIDECEKYIHRLTTNHCEAFNSLITNYAPKDKRFITIYSHLIHLKVLRKLHGPKFVLYILRSLQIPVHDDVRLAYEEQAEKTLENAKRKRSSRYNSERLEKKNSANVGANPDFTYKPESCGHLYCKNKMCVCIKNGTACNPKCGCKGACMNWFNPISYEPPKGTSSLFISSSSSFFFNISSH
jgi:hypothetical protein